MQYFTLARFNESNSLENITKKFAAPQKNLIYRHSWHIRYLQSYALLVRSIYRRLKFCPLILGTDGTCINLETLLQLHVLLTSIVSNLKLSSSHMNSNLNNQKFFSFLLCPTSSSRKWKEEWEVNVHVFLIGHLSNIIKSSSQIPY
jgi:hypothetical protein